MVCVPGVGEAMFSITSSPTNRDYQEFSIKRCGVLTDQLHSMNVGDEILVRGPYGNSFPVNTELKGKNLLFIAGGIGLAPLRSVINYCLDNRENYGTIDILYGSRSADDLVRREEIEKVWTAAPGVNVYLTIDRPQEGWDGHVGFVPTYLKEIGFDTNKVALLCGPPVMIKFCLQGLREIGFSNEQVYKMCIRDRVGGGEVLIVEPSRAAGGTDDGLCFRYQIIAGLHIQQDGTGNLTVFVLQQLHRRSELHNRNLRCV